MHGDHLSHWKPCMHAGCLLVLYSIHISLDLTSVDFQGMLEVLGILLIFMHRGILRSGVLPPNSHFFLFISRQGHQL